MKLAVDFPSLISSIQYPLGRGYNYFSYYMVEVCTLTDYYKILILPFVANVLATDKRYDKRFPNEVRS